MICFSGGTCSCDLKGIIMVLSRGDLTVTASNNTDVSLPDWPLKSVVISSLTWPDTCVQMYPRLRDLGWFRCIQL